ncbi:nucleotide exchange factor GrpE [Trichocoleus sp. DQ-A3]|uniref:nucleotide exchange factor GrpE n=1 Tax=Cyanophyceae TaxID=3028117 RepID=UPI0016858EB5|nr:nucleotide exchange factor GrpE [Coleofasciculus sp. FACHB-125]MBD1901856.1 nucleotide exchange factor GrpE [Coleofasciculus sp. FACHB-125]
MNEEENQQDNTSPPMVDNQAVAQEMGNEPLSETGTLNGEPLGEASVYGTSQTSDAISDASATSGASGDESNAEAASNAAAVEALTREVEALKAQVEERTQQCDSFKTQYMRIAADFENFRKRTLKEKEDSEVQIKCTTITELLPVVDNFERARSQIKPQTDGEWSIHKSYQSVYKQLADALKRIGVSPMRPEGQDFDPNLHEAVMREPTNEYPEGAVIEQLVRGYFLGDRVLRHALVKVAAGMEPVVTSEEGHPLSGES